MYEQLMEENTPVIETMSRKERSAEPSVYTHRKERHGLVKKGETRTVDYEQKNEEKQIYLWLNVKYIWT